MYAMKGDRVFSTGQVAKICQCSSRTVALWCDAGLLSSYRTPAYGKRRDGGDRRITRESLTKFLRERGMELPLELREVPCLLMVGCSFPMWVPPLPGVEIRKAASAFEAGRQAVRVPPTVAVVDLSSLGREAGLGIAAGLLAEAPQPILAAIVGEDAGDASVSELMAAGFKVVFCRPFASTTLAHWITKQLTVGTEV